MGKILTLLGLLASLQIASADVIIYKQKINVTKTGGGTAGKLSYSGWMVTDGESGDITFVWALASSKRFSVVELTDFSFGYVSGASGREQQVISAATDNNGVMFAKGVVSAPLEVGASSLYNVARSYTVSGSDFNMVGAAADNGMTEYKGTIVFDKTFTISANQQGKTLGEAVEAARQALIAAGYVEE